MEVCEGDVVEGMEAMGLDLSSKSAKILDLLRRFLRVQQRRAKAYTRWHRGFAEYMAHGDDLAYQQLCAEITTEFNDCSKQDVQEAEKQKLHLTAKIQILKKAGRPSERLVSHEHCPFSRRAKHECLHVREITEADGTEDAEADAQYESSLKEAIRGVQVAVTSINDRLEEVRYEIEALGDSSSFSD